MIRLSSVKRKIVTTRVAKNTFYLTLASVGQKILAFVYFMMVARIMGVEQTGEYFTATSFMLIFSVLSDLGLQQVLIREVAKTPERARELCRTVIGIKIPFTVLAVALCLGASYLLGYGTNLRSLIALATLVLVLDTTHLTFYAILRGFQQLRFESIGIFVYEILIVSLGLAVLFVHPSLTLLFLVLMSGSVFHVIYSAAMVARHLGAGALVPAFDPKLAKKILRIAFPFFIAAIFMKVYSYIDTIFLSVFVGTVAVGIYSVAYKFTYSLQFVPMAFVAALYPGMSELAVKDRVQLARLFHDAMWYMCLLAVPMVFGLWSIAPEAIAIAGGDYGASAPVLQVLIFALLPIFLDFPIGSLLNATDRQKTKTAIMGVTMVINAVLNALLIPHYGVMGAAIAGVASFAFMFLAGMYFVPKVIPYRFRQLAATAAPILLSGTVMAAVTLLLKPHLHLLLLIPTSAVVYAAGLFFSGSLRLEHLTHGFQLLTRKAYETPPSSDA